MTKVVSIINLKGGVAKTTTTVQLAECLSSEFSKRVLVIDLDPQTNATIALIGEDGWKKINERKQTLFHLFNDKLEKTSDFNISEALLTRGVSDLNLRSLSLLSSSIDFIGIQDRIYKIFKKTGYNLTPMEVLKAAIHDRLDSFDYVLIDCPPNLGFITRNGIEISDYYLIPTIPDTLSTYGIPQIIRKIQDFKTQRSLKIECLGLLITKYSSNSSSHDKVMGDLPSRFEGYFNDIGIKPSPVFNTLIPQANATAAAMYFDDRPHTFNQKYGSTISGGDYLYQYVIELTKEFMQRAGS